MFNKVVLILGGNKGDREDLLQKALDALMEEGNLVSKSSIYQTEAWGGVAKGSFLNQVVQLETHLDPEGLLDLVQKIETNLGRKRSETWGDRTMDIDILYFNDLQLSSPKLQIPHPYIAQRKFVLAPLVEILPDFLHPGLKLTSLEMLEICTDQTGLAIFKKA